MGKQIRVSDDVYERLQKLQGPRESYSEVIERAISIIEIIKDVPPMLGPRHYLRERPKEVKECSP